jgi:hypothetical protein
MTRLVKGYNLHRKTDIKIGFCLGYGHIWGIQKIKGRQKYSARPITLSDDGILSHIFFVFFE